MLAFGVSTILPVAQNISLQTDNDSSVPLHLGVNGFRSFARPQSGRGAGRIGGTARLAGAVVGASERSRVRRALLVARLPLHRDLRRIR